VATAPNALSETPKNSITPFCKLAVQGLVQALSVALEEDDEPEDHTETEWATNPGNTPGLYSLWRTCRRIRYSRIVHTNYAESI